MITQDELLLARWLRSKGLQQADIAKALDQKTHQNIGYHFRKMRKAFFDKEEDTGSNEGEVVSLLVGYVSDLPSPVNEIFHPDHTCIHFVKSAAYAQMEDLEKHEKIWVLLELLKEVEQE